MAEVTHQDVMDEDEGIGPPQPELNPDGTTRRDFISLTAGAAGAVGAGLALWPFVHQMNPAADTLALASIEVDLSAIAEGQSITVEWRGKPVFIRHRTQSEIDEAEGVSLDDMPDPVTDTDRVKDGKSKWLVVLGVCTHLGCVPSGQQVGSTRGEFNGWFCPCHGSHYDTSGRIRKGPAPRNLDVPEYTFLTDTRIKLG
ncbi:MAG: ubiquinol-cytochrome c reductase iron-sulfur subunit [Alphaproteobacteria bacterium]